MTLVLSRPRHRTDLVRELVARDVKLRYRRSVLGVAWSQLAPLSLIAIFTFVFGYVLKLHIPHYPASRYPAFLFVGFLPWLWFQGSLLGGTHSVVGGRDLIGQPGFRVALLPVVSIATNLINYALALPVMFVGIVVYTHRVPVTALALPVIIAVQFVITLGPVYFLSAFNVTFRDVGHIVEILILPLFYATPVFYSEPTTRFHLVYVLNPLAHLIKAYRSALLDGHWPDFRALSVVALVGVVLVWMGHAVFMRMSRHFPEEL